MTAQPNIINVGRDVIADNVNIGGTQTIYQVLPRDQNPIFTQKQHPYTDLIRAVHNIWIQTVLDDALRRVNPGFEIKLRANPDAAGASEAYQHVQIAGSIRQIFTDVDKKLLILGEPASGKTVLMLQLTEQLLQAAATNHWARVPVVVNLSSWAVKREPLDKWLVEEMRKVYGAGKRLTRQLIDGNHLIYMLDGLDEVADAYRDDCLSAINAFTTPDTQVVVCSRITEYHALRDKLAIHNAIELQPLERSTFRDYLAHGGLSDEMAASLLGMLTAEDAVWQQTRKPLFANILIDTYADRSVLPPTREDATPTEQVYQRVIAPYVARQLDQRTKKPHSDAKTRRWLAWVGWQTKEREMTQFYLEALQLDWLHRERTLHILRITLTLTGGLISGLIFGLIGWLVFRMNVGVIFALLFGLGGGLSGIDLRRKLVPHFGGDRMIGRLRGGLIGGLSYGLVFGLSAGLISSLRSGLIGGLIFGLSTALSIGASLARPFSLNPGWRETLIGALNSGLFLGMIGGLGYGLAIGLIVGLRYGLGSWQIFALIAGMCYGVIFGLSIALSFGLGDVLKHLLLRTVLHHTGQFPFPADKFLHYTQDLKLMRQVGGGMLFKHRYLQDYFAAEYEKHYLAGDRGE